MDAQKWAINIIEKTIDIGVNQTFEIPQSVLVNQVFSYKWDELEFW